MTERGTVIKLDKGYACVAFDISEHCAHCRCCRRARDGMHMTANVKNTLGANVGDIVDVDMKRLSNIFSALIYLFPLALVIAGICIGYNMYEAGTAILAAAGLAVGLIVAVPIDVLVIKRKLRPAMKNLLIAEVESETKE